MTLVLPRLPRATQYSVRKLSFANDLTPTLGGPTTRLNRLGTRYAIDVVIPALDAACCGPSLIVDLEQGEIEPVSLLIPEPASVQAGPWGVVRLAGAGQTGMTLALDGGQPQAVVRKGKWLSVQVGGQGFAYRAREAVIFDDDGEAALPIFPMLRRSPANDALIELAEPRLEGLVEMDTEHSVKLMADTGVIGVSFSVTERE